MDSLKPCSKDSEKLSDTTAINSMVGINHMRIGIDLVFKAFLAS
jgi:hypothetical protein